MLARGHPHEPNLRVTIQNLLPEDGKKLARKEVIEGFDWTASDGQKKRGLSSSSPPHSQLARKPGYEIHA